MGQSKKHNFQLKDLDGVYGLSQLLAQYFPHPSDYIVGIYELLLNALEHGNLGIGLEAKTELVRRGLWHREVLRRLSLPEYAGKEVHVTLAQDDRECRLTIADQGEGFPWQDYLQRLPAIDKRPNGRGLLIAFNSKFDHIAFNNTGNEVTCVVTYGYERVERSVSLPFAGEVREG